MNSPYDKKGRRSILSRIGPGIITACVVIGPGSVMTSTKVGSQYGFQLTWVLLVAVFLMMVYMTMGARLGAVAKQSPGDLVTSKAGRWLTVLIGLSVFSISSSYQFGNSLGVHSAMTNVAPGLIIGAGAGESNPDSEEDAETTSTKPVTYSILSLALLVGFNLAAIAFLFAFKDLYRWFEKLMMCFVGIMLVAFAVNLFSAGPNIGDALRGIVPSIPETEAGNSDWIPVLGWIGTTFITAIAYYQAYLVRQKGWTKNELKEGLVDARVGAFILAAITWMIMATAASVFHKEGITPSNVGDVANLLHSFFGPMGQVIFCAGLFCAAYSSFLINSMVGGFLVSDGLGWGADPKKMAPRIGAATIMLMGMVTAIGSIVAELNTVPAIVFAQAVTVIAAPLIGAVLWWLTSSEDVMGDEKNSMFTNIAAGIGFVILLGLSIYIVFYKIIPAITGG